MTPAAIDFLVPVYGQSFAIGTIDELAPVYNGSAISPRVLMPDTGLHFQHDDINNFVELQESINESRPMRSETVCSECGWRLLKGLERAKDLSSNVIMAMVGSGGRRIEHFLPGSKHFQELTQLVRRCAEISRRRERQLKVLGVIFLQGQADSGLEIRHWTRTAQILSLQSTIQSMISDELADPSVVPLVNMDPGKTSVINEDDWRLPEIATAAENAARIAPDRIINVGAAYPHLHSLEPHSGAHPTVTGYRSMGAQIGAALWRHVRGLGHIATSVDSWTMLDEKTAVVRLRLQHSDRLTLDWTNRTVKIRTPHFLGESGGWAARDFESQTNGRPLEILSIFLPTEEHPRLADSLLLTFSRSPGAGLEMTYASNPTKKRTHYGRPRGVVRGSIPLKIADAFPIHNWLIPSHLY